MNRDDKSISSLPGFYIAKGIHYYLSDRPEWLYKIAARCGIGCTLMKICKVCAAILILFFVTDIHRYGAWYTGGATYIKPWWQFGYILLWVPIITAVLIGLLTLPDSTGGMLINIVAILIMNFIFWFFIILVMYMAEDQFMLMHGIFYLRQGKLEQALGVSAMLSVIIGSINIRDYFEERGGE